MGKNKSVKDVADCAAKSFESRARSASTIWGKVGYGVIGALIAGLSALYLGGCGVMGFEVRGEDGGSLVLKRDAATGKVVIVGERPNVEGAK